MAATPPSTTLATSERVAHARALTTSDPLQLALISWMLAGIKTHYLNVRAVAETRPDVALRLYEVNPYIEGGRIERLPFMPHVVKANLRCQLTTLPLLRAATPDVVWTQTLPPTLPFIAAHAGHGRIPVVYDTDSTPRLLASFGPHYAAQVQGPTFKRRLVDDLQRRMLRNVALVVPWSAWAARSLRDDYGVPDERIRVLPPGVRLAEWTPPVDNQRAGVGAVPKLLFVGADFERKGGELLLSVYRAHLAGHCELHLVTKAAIAPTPGVFVYHDFSPNDPGLQRLYHGCDALVLPTRADCYSLASIEAMAAGLPVITTAVGGISEIVVEGETGYLVEPNDGASLRAAIEALLTDVNRRHALGRQGRLRAEAHFDATVNANRLLDMVAALARQPRTPATRGAR